MNTVYVGLDLGSSSFQQVAIKADGSIRMNRSFTTSETNLRAAFADLKGTIHVHLEAGELAPWATSIIAPLVTRVVCSHPQSNAWIAKDADKCDRVDAYKLAELLRLNRFKEVHYAREQSRREFKLLVQHYDELTAQQARLKTKIKARLRMQGVIVRGERLFSATGRKPILAQVESSQVRATIRQLYAVLDQSVATQTEARLLMLRAAQAFPEIKLFRTAPGIGPIGACRFSAYVHTPSRFSSTRKLWKYCRLSVSHRSSNGKPSLIHPPKSITTLAAQEISVLDSDFHTRFVGRRRCPHLLRYQERDLITEPETGHREAYRFPQLNIERSSATDRWPRLGT